MNTCSGIEFNIAAPRVADVRIEDIAHHLSLINRFNGATCRPYSVAEHSLLVMDIMRVDMGVEDPAVLFAGLMHDAHEAYFGDITTEVKRVIGYRAAHAEHKVEMAVWDKFGITHNALVKRADMIALATEKRNLLPASVGQWECLEGIDPSDSFNLMSDFRRQMTWERWGRSFLNAYRSFNSA